MKNKSVAICLGILAIMAWGFYPLSAQQVNPLNPLLGPRPLGDGFMPRQPDIGPQPYGLIPRPGVTIPPPPQISKRSQEVPSDLAKVTQRNCGLVSLPQPLFSPPSSPPSLGAPSSPRTIPVRGPWPGSPESGVKQEAKGSQIRSQQQTVVKPQYEPLSTIEIAFQQVPDFQTTTSPIKPRNRLRQYGYSLFASPISTFAPTTDVPVGPDYILGPGDDLIINVWGAMDSGVMRTVDRNGQIILPSAGPVRVWGLTFSRAERLIREQLSRHYQGFQTSITMGRLRTMRVYVVGEVCQPGSFTLSSLSTVTNALFAAGGPLKLGSLRNIQLKRNHHEVGTTDLYDFLLRGDKTRDFRLESGDTIFVPPVGSIAAITGEVKRPAIYELKGSTRVTDLIEMAGGLTPRSYLKRVQVIRNKPNSEREVIDLDLTNVRGNGDSPRDIELRNGDLVRIYPTDPRIYNTVRLTGAVKHPGEYELKPGMRLTELLRKENFLPEAYVDRIELARLNDNLTTEILSIDIRKAWEGDRSQDIHLQRLDLISVRSEFKVPGAVRLEGEVMRPGIYRIQRGERVSSVIKRAGGFTNKAFLQGAVFTRRSVQMVEKKRLDEFVRAHDQRLLMQGTQLGALTVATAINKDEAKFQRAVLVQRRQKLQVLASKVTLGRVVISLDELDKLEGSPSDLTLEDGDSLKIPHEPATVIVMGVVRNPTGVLHKEDMDVQYYLNRAGGLIPDEADKKGMYLLKADGSAITGFMMLRNIEPGDVIVVPPSTEAKVQWLPFLKDLVTITSQVALGLAGLAAIF